MLRNVLRASGSVTLVPGTLQIGLLLLLLLLLLQQELDASSSGYPDWTFQKVKKQMKRSNLQIGNKKWIQLTGASLFYPMWRVHRKG